jgi:hypothetical protein
MIEWRSRHERVVIPALLRHARTTDGVAMRQVLDEVGYDDISVNGPYVLGGLAMGAGDVPLGDFIHDLRISKQTTGQLVDTLVAQGRAGRRQHPLSYAGGADRYR